MIVRIALLALLLVLAGCNQVVPEDPLIISAKLAIEASLKDPGSVQYRDVEVVEVSTPLGTAKGVCGEFNAKNSMGGYVGFERFAWEPAGGQLITPSSFPKSNKEMVHAALDRYCKEGELPHAQ